jgi:hypothetical protein
MSAFKKTHGFTKTNILMQLNPNHPTNQLSIWVQAMVTNVISYDVLIKGVVLYLVGFVLDFWEKNVSYNPRWPSWNGFQGQLLV